MIARKLTTIKSCINCIIPQKILFLGENNISLVHGKYQSYPRRYLCIHKVPVKLVSPKDSIAWPSVGVNLI